jgi:hypothetical protein
MPESTLLCQRRLYSPVRDLGFDLSMIRAAAMAHFHRNTYRVAEFIDPLRGVKASCGIKWGYDSYLTPL